MGGALVHALVGVGLLSSADVDHQRSRVRLHGDFGILVDVEVRPVPGPGEAAAIRTRTSQSAREV